MRELDTKRVAYIRERLMNVARLESGRDATELVIAFAQASAMIIIPSFKGNVLGGVKQFLGVFTSVISSESTVQFTQTSGVGADMSEDVCTCPRCVEARGPMQ